MALTLPENVIAWLRGIHPDPAWAIVTLFETSSAAGEPRPPSDLAEAELVQLSGKRSLIVVNPGVLRRVSGVTLLPLADGRALIALEPGKGSADLELAIVDRLENISAGSQEHAELTRLRQCLRRWRGLQGLNFRTRSIIVVERPLGAHAARPVLNVGRRAAQVKVHRGVARR